MYRCFLVSMLFGVPYYRTVTLWCGGNYRTPAESPLSSIFYHAFVGGVWWGFINRVGF